VGQDFRRGALVIDLSRVDAVETLTQALAERSVTIDVLINAAGFGIGGPVATIGALIVGP
jgi:short-subunit dehydrogenase